ncbi:hypothetical protein LXA43DRAFT_1047775 [Ganoderma leucocontextum]|nr:hypothetical protein LXA43DRAFT_1047775 [Ganoderma leucocontextum]
MQLASSSFRALKGGGQPHFPAGGGLRSIHIPAFTRPPPNKRTTTAQAVFRHARTTISRFVAHLTTPGTLHSSVHAQPGASGTRAFHRPATRMPTIQDRLSFPARHILSKPLAVPFLPRPPTVPRHITQVGLGTARNFSTGRPIFQHLIENVPVYARTLNEVDWELRLEEERERLRLEKQKARRTSKAAKKARGPLSPAKLNVVSAPVAKASEPEKDELEHYFPTAAVPEVTTHLLIPLAPTPTSRLPLPLNPPPSSSAHPLLPFDVIASMHAGHGTHALRVSTVFARLDTARVFDEPGVHCDARGDPSGLCTVLEVRFEGWTANKVRGILGEAGTGWCVLEEVWYNQEHAEAEEMDAALETLSIGESEASHDISLSGLSDMNGSWSMSDHAIDPSRSFVLPTLDFSASFAAPTWSTAPALPSGVSTPMSDLEFHNVWTQMDSRASSPGNFGSDKDSDIRSAGSDWDEVSRAPSVADVRFGFSSQFSERMQGPDGPREELF